MATNGESETAGMSHPGDEHEVPDHQQHASALTNLKARIAQHYDLASTYYYSLWGQHIHHGLFTNGCTTKEAAQSNLIDFMLEFSDFPKSGADVLDVGCGLGGTSRYLAQHRAAAVTGITISSQQVDLAKKITAQDTTTAGTPTATKDEAESKSSVSAEDLQHSKVDLESSSAVSLSATPFTPYGSTGGKVRFLHLDAEHMTSQLPAATFSHVWVTEALSHIPNHDRFFQSAFDLLAPSSSTRPSRLIIADWFRGPPESFPHAADSSSPGIQQSNIDADAAALTPSHHSTIAQIEDGMLLPTLPSIHDYIAHAQTAGFTLTPPLPLNTSFSAYLTGTNSTAASTTDYGNPIDLSGHVSATWDISWSLVSSPSLWAYAISQGRDGLSFLQSFRAMRRGYKEGSLRYGVLVLEKPVLNT